MSCDNIMKCKFCEPSTMDNFSLLRSYLPEEYEYMVCSFTVNGSNFKTRLRTASKEQKQAQKWLEDFQMHSKCTMRVERTYPHSGTKNVFKIDLRCQHNTRPRSDKVREKDRCKNTDCPAKMGITVKRVVTERKSRSKDPHLPNYPTVIQMDFSHNHPISTPEILRHRSVLPEVKGKILSLFRLGHNPSTALDMHKYDLQLEHGENYNRVCQDRALLPDPQFCYRLYYKILRRRAAITNGDSQDSALSDVDLDFKLKSKTENGIEDLPDCSSMDDRAASEFNNDMPYKKVKKKRKLESMMIGKDKITNQLEKVLLKFCENGGFAGMQLVEKDTVMALCTPLMHRVHTMISQSSELVFVDTYGELDEPNSCKVFMFLTYTGGGVLPLGCLVTTSISLECMKAAFDLWKQILPDDCFCGKKEGPQIFLTGDNESEKQCLKAVFPSSHLFVCISHLLQSTWCFLWDRKSAVKKEHRSLLFSKVKILLFSQSIDELEINYAYGMQDSLAKTYSSFVDHYNSIYNRRHEWCLAYRRHLLPGINDLSESIYWEASIILLKDPILSCTRIYNLLQIMDFLSRLDTYYERRLIDLVNNRLENVKHSRFLFIDMPQEAYTITQKSENEYEVHNDVKDTTYHLDITLGMCECRVGRYGAPCKHQLLVFRNFSVPSYECVPLNTLEERALVLQLATGQKIENSILPEVSSNFQNIILNDSCSSDLNIHDLAGPDGGFFLDNGSPTCDAVDQSPLIDHEVIVTSHHVPINHHDHQTIPQHNHVLGHHHHHPMLNQHALTENDVLHRHRQTMEHHTNLSHPEMQCTLPQTVQPQMNQHPVEVRPNCHSLQEPHPQIQQLIIQSQQPPPPIQPEADRIAQQTPEQTVHALIEEISKKMKQKTSRTPQIYAPALDTFLKNLDKLSSSSSFEYALYTFGKFSKSSMPMFRRKVHNNKLVGLQSAGDMKKKNQSEKSSGDRVKKCKSTNVSVLF